MLLDKYFKLKSAKHIEPNYVSSMEASYFY